MTELSKDQHQRILDALKNPKWDFRTAKGISKDTGVDIAIVREFLNTRKDRVWRSGIPDGSGEPVYTIRNSHALRKELWQKFKTFVARDPMKRTEKGTSV